MRSTPLKLFFQLYFFWGLVTGGFSQGFSSGTEVRLQAVLEEFQNNPENPFVGGMVAAIEIDGIATWVGSTGYAARNINEENELLPGGTPFLPETPSRIYSVTKTFTAALTIELAAEGIISLDDRVGKYLSIQSINPQLSDEVTVRQLLAHESGFSDYTNEPQFRLAIASEPGRFWEPLEILPFARKINDPGVVRSYSSTNYLLLGIIMEIATGKPAAELYRNRFFTPLGLSSMYLEEQEPAIEPEALAAPHDKIGAFNPIFQANGQPTFPDYYTNVSNLPFTAIVSSAFTTGAIVGNIHDLVSWGNALFTGKATRSSTLETMLNSIGDVPEPDGDYLGYGLWTNDRISETDFIVGHNGSATGYRSLLAHQPDRKITIAILSNYAGADNLLYPVAQKLYQALPDIYCESDEEKVQLCLGGKEICVPRWVVPYLTKRGAYIGDCEPISIRSIAIIDAETHEWIQELTDNDHVDLADLSGQKLTIVARTEPDLVGRVDFVLNGPYNYRRTDYLPPYALFGNTLSNYWGKQLPLGEYTLSATPYELFSNSKGIPMQLDFSIIDSTPSPASEAAAHVPSSEFSVYPVPTNGILYIQNNCSATAQIVLMDDKGKSILTRISSHDESLDLSSYRRGIYYLKFISQTAVQTRKVVLE